MATSQTGREVVNAGIKVTLANWTGRLSTEGSPPTMKQIAGFINSAPKEFTFPFRPLPIQQEGFGPEMAEVERPYSTPIIDIKAGRARRFSFEAPLTLTGDAISGSIDRFSDRLREIADDGIPLIFTNMPDSITKTSWYMTELNFSTDRTLINGPTLRETATMSFVEYKPYQPKFVFLRPISYGVPPDKKAKKQVAKNGNGIDPLADAYNKEATTRSNNAGLSGRPNPNSGTGTGS